MIELTVPADHPAFAGHFPGAPVLPGVVLLGWVLEAALADPALAARLGEPPTLEQVKWLAPVRPGERITIALAAEAAGLTFEVTRTGRPGQPVARGRIGCPRRAIG